MSSGELILYQTDDGQAEISLHAIDGTVWLTQDDIAELFDKGRSTITEHIQNIFSDGELIEDSVCRKFRQTAADGKDYNVLHYNLEMILAIGYRVRSPRGVQFRKWANTVLKEYLVKGFAMDDKRLKQAEKWDYFDEWLARIRDIRASEKRFYQKIKDIYTTAIDYDKSSDQAQFFFKKVQNKMLWAVTGHTAAELIQRRSDPDKPNIGVMSWKGSIVRKGDVGVAKNYLNKDEVEELNRSSHPKKLPPQVLTEPYVNLSTHTALPIQSIYYHKTIASGQTSQVGVERHPAANVPLVAGVHGNV